MTITLEQIKAEAERIFGAELRVTIEPYTAAQYVAGATETKHWDGLVVFEAGNRKMDVTYRTSDLERPLDEFTDRLLEQPIFLLKYAKQEFSANI